MSPKPVLEHTVSTVAKYDIDGDGELDEAELALAKMDREGSGNITKEDMHALMKEHLSTERSLWNMKKLSIGLAGLVVIQSLGMLGASFAAAILAKDSKSQGDDLVDSATGVKLGMQTTSDLHPSMLIEQSSTCVKGSGVRCATNSWVDMDIDHGKMVVDECSHDRTVHLTRFFTSGKQMHFALCPLPEGHSAVYDTNAELPTASISTATGFIVIKPNEEGSHYEITGDGVMSDVGYPCDSDVDCETNLVCNSENLCESSQAEEGM